MGRLFWKILLTFWLTLLVTGGITGLSVWLHHNERSSSHEHHKHHRVRPSSMVALQSAANVYEYAGKEALTNLLRDMKEDRAFRHSVVFAVDPNGKELLDRSVSPEVLSTVRESLVTKSAVAIARRVGNEEGENYILFIPKADRHRSQPNFFKERRPPHDRHGKPKRPPPPRGWLLIVVGIITSFVSSFLLAWYFSRPIRSLRSAFHSLASGDLDQRVTSSIGSRRDDLADLGKDFDEMADKLQNSMTSQRRLLHDVSHELRSPLARLHLSIGLAKQKPEKIDNCLDRIELEAKKLDKLVGEVLTLSRLESGTPQPMEDGANILEILQAVIEDVRFEAKALSRNVIFNCEVTEPQIIKGNSELLHRALENVLRNAIHHTPQNTVATLSVTKDKNDSALQITIDDQGSGVPDDELDKIFEPFQRSTNIKTDIDGFGLGLAIARRAVNSHHGSIRAVNLEEKGLRIEIVLPVTKGTAK